MFPKRPPGFCVEWGNGGGRDTSEEAARDPKEPWPPGWGGVGGDGGDEEQGCKVLGMLGEEFQDAPGLHLSRERGGDVY